MAHLAVFASGLGQRLELGTTATPTSLKPHEILVDVVAVGVNPVDWKVRDLGIFAKSFHPPWPKILGVDAAGTVIATGSGVTRFRIGDGVAGYVRMNKGNLVGSFQKVVTMWSDIAFPIPPSISFADAATLPLAYSTASTALNLDLGFPLPGSVGSTAAEEDLLSQSVLVIGGSAAIGQCALQLLRLAGFKNIITISSPGREDYLKSLGANLVLDRLTPIQELERAILASAGGKLKHVFDVISSEMTQELASRVIDEEAGRVVLTGSRTRTFPTRLPPIETFGGKVFDATASSPGNGRRPSDYQFGAASWATLSEMLASGKFKTLPTQTVGGDGPTSIAGRLEAALELSKAGRLDGQKLVVIFD